MSERLKMEHSWHMNKLEYFQQETLQLLSRMLLYERVNIEDIPFEIRTSRDGCLYTAAFRNGRNKAYPCEGFVKMLSLLCDDLLKIDTDNKERPMLLERLCDAIYHNEHEGEKCFEDFKENIPESILLEMYTSGNVETEVVKKRLEKCGLIKRERRVKKRNRNSENHDGY